jgi:protein involved in polysaccharide export with SLBB domain
MLDSRRRRLPAALQRFFPALLLLFPACALPGGPPISEIAAEINATLNTGKFVIGPGDQILASFRDAPDLSHTVTVRADGWASFTGVDDVQCAGLTLEQLDARLTELYSKDLAAGNLTLQLVSVGRHWVTVMGEVEEPGQLTIEPDGRLSLIDAIGKAGGFDKATAHISNTLLVRWDAKKQRQVAWKLDARPKYWETGEPIYLQPYDVVFIPNTPIDRIGIWVDMYIRRLIPFPYILPFPQQ